MKHIKSEKLYTVITSLLVLLLITNISVFALDETSNEIQSQNTINNPTTPPEIIKTTTMSGAAGRYGTGNPSSGSHYPTKPKSSFSVPVAHTSKYKPPLWVDTENKIGSKVYIDMNNQYYFLWGQVYTVKYDKNEQTNYVQIELKGLRGNRAAILSVSSEYKKVYEIPSKREYKEITPDKAIYNSTKIALENTNKPNCPSNICKYKR